jgi:hypothetical protein
MRREETVTIDLLQRAVPAKHTDEGLQALSGGIAIRPERVQKFGDRLSDENLVWKNGIRDEIGV